MVTAELMAMVRDYSVPAATILDYIEDFGWTREWLWQRLKALDMEVLEVLARLSRRGDAESRPTAVACKAIAWLNGINTKELVRKMCQQEEKVGWEKWDPDTSPEWEYLLLRSFRRWQYANCAMYSIWHLKRGTLDALYSDLSPIERKEILEDIRDYPRKSLRDWLNSDLAEMGEYFAHHYGSKADDSAETFDSDVIDFWADLIRDRFRI